MHTDARTLEEGTLIEGDICIVGAGAAGISMAMEWIGAGHDVVLLEGGGFDYDYNMQALYAGKAPATPIRYRWRLPGYTILGALRATGPAGAPRWSR